MIKSCLELLAQADATLQDNTTKDITAAEVRQMVKDVIDTFTPAYGGISCTSVIESLTATPAVIAPFTSQIAATTGYFTTNLTSGTVTRLVQSASLAGATDIVMASGSVEGPVNDLVTVALFKNGAATGASVGVTCQGVSRPVAFNLSGLSYTPAPGDAVFELRASGDTGNKTFTGVSLLVQANPVRSFT